MLTGKELGEAIERARKLKGVTKVEMARHFDVKPPSVSGWIATGRIDKQRLTDLFAYFADVVTPSHWGLHGRDVDYFLLSAASTIKEELQIKESNVIAADFSAKDKTGDLSIPQFNVRAAMGSGQVAADYVEIVRHVTMHRSHLDMLGITFTSPANLAVITGWGQSMEGTINHGEPVFVDRGVTEFTGDGVYLLTWDNMLYIKRLQKESKTHFKMISDNRAHDPQVVPMADVIIHARALLAWNARKL